MAIESRAFRTEACENGYSYAGLFVYSPELDETLAEHYFPDYKLKTAGGPVEEFVGLLANMSKIKKDLEDRKGYTKEGRLLHGADFEGGDNGISFTFKGDMYFPSPSSYSAAMSAIDNLIALHGWVVAETANAYTYAPNQAALWNTDPVDAASKAIIGRAFTDMSNGFALFSSNDETFAKAYAQVQKGGWGQMANEVSEAFVDNMGGSVAAAWQTAGEPVVATIHGKPMFKSITMVPTSLTYSLQDYVIDDLSGEYAYPTKMSIDMKLTNPYGGLLTSMRRSV